MNSMLYQPCWIAHGAMLVFKMIEEKAIFSQGLQSEDGRGHVVATACGPEVL